MAIEGIKQIQRGIVKRISVDLDSKFTNGHTFCEMLIDEENGRFTAVLYGGESYTFKNNDKEFICLLIRELQEEDDWLYRQLRDARLDDVVDVEATTDAMIAYIKDSPAYKEDPTYYNSLEEMQEGISGVLGNNAPLISHNIWDVWHSWFEGYINDDLLPGVSEMHDEGIHLIKLEGDWKCRAFCEKVAPILAEVLKEEYKEIL